MFIPAFFIVLSLFVVYRVVKDRANNCLSILYINGVRSYHYVTSLLIFYTLFLLIFMIMFSFSFLANLDTFSSLCPSRNTHSESQVLPSGIFCGVAFIAPHSSFSLVVASNHRTSLRFFPCRSLATIVNIFINAIGALLFNSDFNTSLIFAMLPGSFMMIVTQYIAYPSLKRRILCNEAFIYSLISTILFIILSYVVMWLSQDLSITLDRVRTKMKKGSYIVLSEETRCFHKEGSRLKDGDKR